MYLSDTYDVPSEIANAAHSPAFDKFLRNWFWDALPLTMGELDISFLDDLTSEELAVARDLIRRNLSLRYDHIVQGAAALRDIDAAPALRRLLETEPDESRALIIAGALWNLVRDPVFIERLNRAKRKGRNLLRGAHLDQILWLDDERAVDFLIDLLEDGDLRGWAVTLLNFVELGHQPMPSAQMPHQPEYYRAMRSDPEFRKKMVAAVKKWNRGKKSGRTFGWWDGTERPSLT